MDRNITYVDRAWNVISSRRNGQSLFIRIAREPYSLNTAEFNYFFYRNINTAKKKIKEVPQ